MSINFKTWIESEEWPIEEGKIYNGNTDVIVEFDNGTKWSATFFTYTNISSLVEKNKATGECLQGKYFWGNNMIFVDEIGRERIEEVIRHLIDEDEFQDIFSKCSV